MLVHPDSGMLLSARGMSYQTVKRHGELQMHIISEKASLKGYMLYDSNSMTYGKCETIETK